MNLLNWNQQNMCTIMALNYLAAQWDESNHEPWKILIFHLEFTTRRIYYYMPYDFQLHICTWSFPYFSSSSNLARRSRLVMNYLLVPIWLVFHYICRSHPHGNDIPFISVAIIFPIGKSSAAARFYNFLWVHVWLF